MLPIARGGLELMTPSTYHTFGGSQNGPASTCSHPKAAEPIGQPHLGSSFSIRRSNASSLRSMRSTARNVSSSSGSNSTVESVAVT